MKRYVGYWIRSGQTAYQKDGSSHEWDTEIPALAYSARIAIETYVHTYKVVDRLTDGILTEVCWK